MDFSFTPDELEFENEVKEFFKENPVADFPYESHDQGNSLGAFSQAFYKKLGEAGYLSLMWPEEYGGRGASVMKGFILIEQMGYHKAPFAAWHLGQAAPREIIKQGTVRAKQELLPKIKNGDLIFWLGYSEPQAGSDLLALETNAYEDGDHFVINGQKVWSTWALYSDWVYLLTITDRQLPRGRNLSIFLVDKNTPGITVEPILSLADIKFQNLVHFDNVRVHKDFLLGEKNKAITLMLAGLESDRFWSRAAKPIWLRKRLEDFVGFLQNDPLGKDILSAKPWVENTLAKFRIEMEIARLFAFRCAWMLTNDVKPNYESSVLKFFVEELAVRYNDFVVDTLGLMGTIRHNEALPFDDELCNYYMYSIPYTAAGGTTDIQRETIVRQKYGLKRVSIKEPR